MDDGCKRSWELLSQSLPSETGTDIANGLSNDTQNAEKNAIYVNGLLDNLTQVLDKWIINGARTTQTSVYNLVRQIEREAQDPELVKKAKRMVKRAGLPLEDTSQRKKYELGATDAAKRRNVAEERQRWEAATASTNAVGDNVARSALSRRAGRNGKPDLFLQNTDRRLDPQSVAEDKAEMEKFAGEDNDNSQPSGTRVSSAGLGLVGTDEDSAALTRISELVARAGAGDAFTGDRLGIGGLDEVLSQVKRRVFTPLAAPPKLLKELGIHPVRGLLLYGRPGCGKTLIARQIGQLFSPARPITVVAGPEVMDKFVGSSEKNLREIFNNPPDIYDTFRLGEPDGGDSIAANALHVIILDEFDAIARARGGRGGSQGDAGVARDSLVNQFLACLDGVDPPIVPTLCIGLTNKRSLIDPALLRPGRFEVQIEVPLPRSNEQRISILKVHTKSMHAAGRLLVSDPPPNTAAARYLERNGGEDVLSYESFLSDIAEYTNGMSGASLAGVARAAASHALERVVGEYSTAVIDNDRPPDSMLDCVVTRDDFDEAIKDVYESGGDRDWEPSEDEAEDAGQKEKSDK
ncbi:AAA ATPase forming ring-shaped complexes [Seminavis robusta]|uniref:Vesicle-fusing ATPase n=1 Tax=Seminavis robusta TaxID=568900 RepID=A0A9N8DIV6_9STRA|nr:AAA ATPase forming ring-shaped complexes [Seminavis robusta]|eukprot:Sro151_g069250.1 AAA ATPase forming ring-shaped complexes (578) ;mRNA; r:67443-69839